MEPNEKNKSPYPEEYTHIGDKVKEIQERIKYLEKLKEENQGVSQYNLNYNPPGFHPPGFKVTQKSTIPQRESDLNKEIELLRTTAFNEIDQTLKGDKSDAAKVVREQVRNEFFPNQILSMEEKEIAKLPEKSKDIEASQDFTDYLRLKSQNKIPVKSEKNETRTIDDSQRFSIDAINFFKDKTSKEQGKEELPKASVETPKEATISARFSQTLGYTKALENSKIEKTPNRDKGDLEKE